MHADIKKGEEKHLMKRNINESCIMSFFNKNTIQIY